MDNVKTILWNVYTGVWDRFLGYFSPLGYLNKYIYGDNDATRVKIDLQGDKLVDVPDLEIYLSDPDTMKSSDPELIKYHEHGDGRVEIALDTHLYHPDNIKVTLCSDRLCVVGRFEEWSDSGSSMVARHFKREFKLPGNVEKRAAQAGLSVDGILTLVVNKFEDKKTEEVEQVAGVVDVISATGILKEKLAEDIIEELPAGQDEVDSDSSNETAEEKVENELKTKESGKPNVGSKESKTPEEELVQQTVKDISEEEKENLPEKSTEDDYVPVYVEERFPGHPANTENFALAEMM